MDDRTRNIEIVVGVFVLVCVAIGVVIFSVLLRKEHTFEPRITVSAVFDNARGLRPGAPVWLSGIGVGSVQWVGFDEGDQVLIMMSMLDIAQQKVHKDAVARIVPMSLVGTDTMVVLTRGSPSAPLITDGETLRTERTPDLYEFVDRAAPSLDHLTGLLANLENLTSRAVEPDGQFQTTLTNAGNIIADIERGEGTLGALIKDRQVYDDAVKLVEIFAQAAEEIRDVSTLVSESAELWPGTVAKAGEAAETARTAAKDLVVLIEEAEGVVSNANVVLESLKEASADMPAITRSSKKIAANIEAITDNLRVASDGVPALVEASREGIEDAANVVNAAKSTWLLRDYFPKGKPDTSVTIDRREGVAPAP